MAKKDSAIDRLFLRASYTSKFKLVLAFSYLPYIVLAVLAYALFIQPSQEIERQRLGAEMYHRLTTLTGAILHYPSPPKSDPADTARIDAALDQLFNAQMTLSTGLSSQPSQDSLNLETQLARFRAQWESRKTGASLTSGQWLDAYHDLTHAISPLAGWRNNFDAATRSLVHVLLDELPLIPPESLDYAAGDIRRTQLDNPSYAEEPLNLKTNDALAAYRQALDPEKRLEAGLQLTQRLTEQWMATLDRQMHTLLWYSFWTFLPLALGIGISIIFYISRIMRRPVNQLVLAAEQFAAGNFSARVPVTAQDEVGAISQAFNAMAASIENSLRQAAEHIQKMTQSASVIIQSGKELDGNFRAQDKTLKDIVNQARSLLHVDQEFADTIQKISEETASTEAVASIGQMSMRDMESIMQRMIGDSSNIVKTLASLQDKVSAINQVIETIVKVADQSNLLSLNTAIRANQAGEQGRGFTVIANKIREMANQIAYATLDIERIIQDVVAAVSQAVNEVGLFSKNVFNQVNDTQAISEELNHLIEETQAQVRNFAEIHEGIQGQTQGIGKINTSIEQLRAVSQQTTLSIGQLYVQIEGLHAASQGLRQLTGQYAFSKQE